MSNPARVFRPGSSGDIATRHMAAHGPASLSALAVVLEKTEGEVDAALAFPVRMGLMERTETEAGVMFRNAGDSSAAPVGGVAVATTTKPASYPKPASEYPKAVRPAKAESLPIPTTKNIGAGLQFLAANDPQKGDFHTVAVTAKVGLSDEAALSEVAGEAAALAPGVDTVATEAAQESARRINTARELVSSLLPVLEVQAFDVARFEGGRLALVIDGVLHVLTPDKAQRLYRYLDGQELGAR